MTAPTVTLVVAMGANRVIGADGDLPWRLPEDLSHFKAITLGHPLVMGRATYESIGRPLPGRTTIVVTRNRDWSAAPPHHESVLVTADLGAAIALAGDLDDEVFLVGGGQVYAEALDRDLVDLMVVTRVAQSPPGDTYFPVIDWERWREVGRVPHAGFDIVTYARS